MGKKRSFHRRKKPRKNMRKVSVSVQNDSKKVDPSICTTRHRERIREMLGYENMFLGWIKIKEK